MFWLSYWKLPNLVGNDHMDCPSIQDTLKCVSKQACVYNWSRLCVQLDLPTKKKNLLGLFFSKQFHCFAVVIDAFFHWCFSFSLTMQISTKMSNKLTTFLVWLLSRQIIPASFFAFFGAVPLPRMKCHSNYNCIHYFIDCHQKGIKSLQRTYCCWLL